jgi:UDP-GlcNAc3NAcA epimerase
MKIITIIGARPQFIKAASISAVLKNEAELQEVLVHTGQHFDPNMSQIFFEELEIPAPRYNLGISGGLHGVQTGRMLEGIEKVLLEEKPDVVLVYGDTNSTLAGALAAAKLSIKLVHVEAGLRSFNKNMPEEINRLITDHLSDILFVPTQSGLENLLREGIERSKIHLVGDVMLDSALYFGVKATQTSRILKQLKLKPKSYILATIHRAENTDNPNLLNSILKGLALVAERVPVIMPLHPRTRNVIENNSSLVKLINKLYIIDPVGYLDMIMLEKSSCLIATDSGGVQKEAFFYGIPCVTLRGETEWVELIDLGWNTLIPPTLDSNIIANIIISKINTVGKNVLLYGNGTASKEIVKRLTA